MSDLDYGQDAARLADTLRARRIDSVTVYLFTFRDDSLFKSVRTVSYPNWRAGSPPPVTGWVAASSLLVQGIPGIPWLAQRTPVTRVGKTIGLYWMPERTVRTRWRDDWRFLRQDNRLRPIPQHAFCGDRTAPVWVRWLRASL